MMHLLQPFGATLAHFFRLFFRPQNGNWPNSIIALAGITLEALIAFRMLRSKLIFRYPAFFTFFLCVLLCDIGGAVVHTTAPNVLYAKWYWATEFLGLFLVCGVILEILGLIVPKRGKPNPLTVFAWTGFGGAMFFFSIIYPFLATLIACIVIAEIIRYAVTADGSGERIFRVSRIVLFGAIICCSAAATHAAQTKRYAYPAIERDFYAILAIFLAGIIGAIFYYGLPVGTNLKGVILGFGVNTGVVLVLLTIRVYAGPSFYPTWVILQPLSWVASCAIWLVMLWTPDGTPYPVIPLRPAPARDESLYDDAKRMWGTVRAHLARVAQP